MRIFLIPAYFYFLCLSLPTTGAALDDSSIDRAPQINHAEVVRGPGDTTKAGSWTSFLNPSYIIESIQNATQAIVPPKPLPSPSDFWEMTMEYEKHLQDYVPRMLGNAADFFKSTNFTDITHSMHHIVDITATFRGNIQGALDTHQVTFDVLTEELEGIFVMIVNELEKSAPDKASGHADRVKIVDKVLDDTALALITLAAHYGIEEEVVTTYLLALKPHVQALVVAVGDINEQHPDLFPALAFSVAVMLIPESWILRPFLSIFGFGPTGPVKGSAAAWLQSHFWGAAVKPGSWFALLQKAGMGVYPEWASFLTKVSIWVGGLSAIFHPDSQGE